MKKLYSYLIIILFCETLVAQSNFHKIYDYSNHSDFGKEIIVSDKDFVVFGFTSAGGFTSKFLKVDSIGNTLFHKGYVIKYDDIWGGGTWYQGYYGFGSHYDSTEGAADSHFMYVNNSGDSVKTVIIDFAFNDRIHDAILLTDSTFIVMGFYTDSALTDNKPFVAHVDSLGSILWMKTHENSSGLPEFIVNLTQTKDGGYVFSGEEYETSQGWLDKFLYKVDSAGDSVWRKTFHDSLTQRAGDVISCSDGGFAFVGSGYANHSAQRSIIKLTVQD